MRRLALMLSGLLLVSSLSAVNAAEMAVVPNAELTLDEAVMVPAQEAGVIVDLPVRDGQQVKVGDLLAQIDDVIPQKQKEVNAAKLKAAQTEAKSNITVRYAKAAAEHALAEYKTNVKANQTFPGSVVEVRLDELRLKYKEMELSTEKALKDLAVAGCQAEVAEAELKAAQANIERRCITAGLDAVVVEVKKRRGEWAQAGETVMYLVRVNRLRVEGSLNASDYRPSEILGRPVSVTVDLARDQKITIPNCKIVFVTPVLTSGKDFTVRAEVPNRKEENGAWVLCPGMRAEMNIQLQ